jgi:hypothetical protein
LSNISLNMARIRKVDYDLIILIYNELMTNAIHQNLVKYLSKQYYYDTIQGVLKEHYDKSYQTDVLRKIISQELKRKSGAITLKIISMYKIWDGVSPESDLIKNIRAKVPCPKKYVHYVINSI